MAFGTLVRCRAEATLRIVASETCRVPGRRAFECPFLEPEGIAVASRRLHEELDRIFALRRHGLVADRTAFLGRWTLRPRGFGEGRASAHAPAYDVDVDSVRELH